MPGTAARTCPSAAPDIHARLTAAANSNITAATPAAAAATPAAVVAPASEEPDSAVRQLQLDDEDTVQNMVDAGALSALLGDGDVEDVADDLISDASDASASDDPFDDNVPVSGRQLARIQLKRVTLRPPVEPQAKPTAKATPAAKVPRLSKKRERPASAPPGNLSRNPVGRPLGSQNKKILLEADDASRIVTLEGRLTTQEAKHKSELKHQAELVKLANERCDKASVKAEQALVKATRLQTTIDNSEQIVLARILIASTLPPAGCFLSVSHASWLHVRSTWDGSLLYLVDCFVTLADRLSSKMFLHAS